jgi:hypothetical protein
MSDKPETGSPANKGEKPTGYTPPKIDWEEEFEPAAQATSCAFYPGECFGRPQTS